jgi:hypothetical protein
MGKKGTLSKRTRALVLATNGTLQKMTCPLSVEAALYSAIIF